jgi:hypothetical protein
VFVAIQKLKEKAHKIATHMLQADASRVSFEGGSIRSRKPQRQQRNRNSEPVVPVGEAPQARCRNRRLKANRV